MAGNANRSASAKIRKAGKVVFIAAAMVMALTAAAFAADYVINRRDIFFFDTLGAMAAARAGGGLDTNSYTAPGSAEANENLETVAEGVARTLEIGRYGGEALVSDETDSDPATMWERRRVTKCEHEDYGSITNEYLTGGAYAERLVIDGLIDWDLSHAAGLMTPDEGGQYALASRDGSGRIVMANALLGYTTAEGKRFQIEYVYDVGARHMEEKEYILSSEYDGCRVYTTDDGVEALVKEYDGQIWVKAVDAGAGNEVFIYTTGCTAGEIDGILDGLNLSSAMNAGQ